MTGGLGGKAPRVLFISHDAGRTGAPRALLDSIPRLIARGVSGAVILRADGPLQAEFGSLLPTSVVPQATEWSPGVLPPRARRLLRPVRSRSWLRRFLRVHGPFDVALSNTATNGALVQVLNSFGIPIVSHAHEMGFWIDHMLGAGLFAAGADVTSRWIAASEAVAEALRRRGVADGDIEVVFEPTSAITRPVQPAAVRDEANLPQTSRLILGAGTLDWRKGPDLFVQVARHLVLERNRTDTYFIWVGGGSALDVARLEHDIGTSCVGRNVVLLGERMDAAPYLAAADVVAITSREDPYPIVMLEAGAAGVPVVAFSASGGAEEFATAGGGCTVDYLDVHAMSSTIEQLLDDDRRRQELGATARRVVEERSDPDVVADHILAVLLRAQQQP